MSAATDDRRPPQQERSKRTLERILTAGVEVFAERGYEGLSIADVCQRSGVSAGSLYARFASKEQLVRAIHHHAMSELMAEGVALFADGPEWRSLSTPDLIENAVRVLLEHFRQHAGIIRASILRSAADPQMREAGLSSIGPLARAFCGRLLDRAGDLPHPDPADAVAATFSLAFEAIAWDVAFGAEFRLRSQIGGDLIDVRLPAVCRLYLLSPEGG